MKLKTLALILSLAFSGIAQSQTTAGNFESKEISTVLKAGGVDQAWARGYTGKGVLIGVIDQGFDITHADFTGSIAASRNFNPTVAKTSGTTVTWGLHGTQMASIAAGNINSGGTAGVAPDARLILAQAGQGGSSSSLDSNAVRQALDWVSLNGAHVINMSFGSNFDTNFQKGIALLSPNQSGVWVAPSSYGSMYSYTATDMAGYKVATDRGSILVASAGNQGLPYAAFPGAFATQVDKNGNLVLGGRMLIVGATDSTGTTIASFSNRAGHICTNLSGSQCNDPYRVKDFFVVAPGMQVYGAAPNQMNIGTNGAIPVNGTSPSAAYVSGGIALMKQAWPQLRPEQLVAVVLNTAKDLGAKGVDDVYGHGMVDFDAATRPMGAVVLANASKLTGSGPTGKTIALASTGVKTTCLLYTSPSPRDES
jgi:subtilisin family serine protease